MSEIVMTDEERVQALEGLGYTHIEAQFLCLPALHGGYFLRRHYSQFLGREDGGTVTQLVQKALGKGHARASTWRQNTQLYHLCNRSFYGALGQGDNRNRRMRQMTAIRNKIMGLDYVLEHPDHIYLATESQKLAWFKTLQVPQESLPATVYHSATGPSSTRYFVEKFPVFLKAREGLAPLPNFCFVDEGLVGLSAFETFLNQHRALFSALSEFDVIYVAASKRHFEAARARFERYAAGQPQAQSTAPDPEELRRLLEYFEMRSQFESGAHNAFDREKLIRFRNARDSFSGKENDVLFVRWKTGGATAVEHILCREKPVNGPLRGTFSTHFLEHDYSLFASVVAA